MRINCATNMKKLIDRLIQNRNEIIWVMFGQSLFFLGAAGSIKILTNLMGPTGYGELALGLSLAGMVTTFFFGPIGQAVVRFFSAYQEDNELGFYFYLLKKGHLLIVVVLLCCTILTGSIVYVLSGYEWAILIIMALLFSIVNGVNNSLTSLQNAMRQRKVAALHQGGEAVFRPLFALCVISLLGNSGASAITGFLLLSIFIVLSRTKFIQNNKNVQSNWRGKRPPPNILKSRMRGFFSYASPFMAISIFVALSTYSDRWILLALLGSHEVGIYASIYQIASAPILFLSNILFQLAIPVIFERAGTLTSNNQIKDSLRLLRYLILSSSALMIIVFSLGSYFSKIFVEILSTPEFSEYHGMLWVIMLGCYFFTMGQILFVKAQIFKKPKVILPTWIIKTISFFVMAIILIKKIGVSGAAFAYCLSSLMFLLSVFFTCKNITLPNNP